MKLGMSLYSYGADLHARKMTVHNAIEHAASIGCDGIEIIGEQHIPNWGNPKYADLVAMRKHIESLGMEVANFSCYLNDMIRTHRKQTMAEIVETAEQEIYLASILGAKVIRPVYLNISDVKGGDMKTSRVKDDLLEIISGILPLLKEKNIIWALEIHAPFSPEYYHDVIKAIESPFVRLLPDFSCWQTDGLPSEYQFNEIRTFVDILPYVAHCHGKAHVFDVNGEEPNTPYRELLQALKNADYKGYVVGEYEGWWMQYADSRTMVEKHFNLLKRYGRSS